MFIALMKRYESEIEDAVYRIDAINEHNLIIPEHTDILGEVDKMLQKISNAEDRLAALEAKCTGGSGGDVSERLEALIKEIKKSMKINL